MGGVQMLRRALPPKTHAASSRRRNRATTGTLWVRERRAWGHQGAPMPAHRSGQRQWPEPGTKRGAPDTARPLLLCPFWALSRLGGGCLDPGTEQVAEEGP